MVEHQVNDYSRHGDIQPDWQRPASNSLMFCEISPPGAIESKQDQRHNDHREDHVRNQDGEVERAHDSLPQEPGVAVVVVINQV